MNDKEKIEEAKRLYRTANADQRYVLESLFHELKESEDERIRKAIKYCIKQGFIGHGRIENVIVDDCLAWLEKQVPKPKWSDEDEKIILSIEQVMNCASLLNIVPEKVDKIRTWLKSLKQRMEGINYE